MIKKFFVYLVLLPLFALPTLTFGRSSTPVANYSEEELVKLIQELQQQLEEIRKNKVQCSVADIDLSIGDGEGDNLREAVEKLQNFLKEKGYFAHKATGYFGKVTRASLINFQKSMNLAPTGELDLASRNSIKTLKCRKDYTSSKEKDEKKDEKKHSEKTDPQHVVSSIALSANGKYVSWSTVGYSKNGFKVVWSKNPQPTFPSREGDAYTYLSDPSASTTNIEPFHGEGKYYVRVCEYLGGSCGTYSNEVKVVL